MFWRLRTLTVWVPCLAGSLSFPCICFFDKWINRTSRIPPRFWMGPLTRQEVSQKCWGVYIPSNYWDVRLKCWCHCRRKWRTERNRIPWNLEIDSLIKKWATFEKNGKRFLSKIKGQNLAIFLKYKNKKRKQKMDSRIRKSIFSVKNWYNWTFNIINLYVSLKAVLK